MNNLKLIKIDNNDNVDKLFISFIVNQLRNSDTDEEQSTFKPIFKDSSEYYLLYSDDALCGFIAFEFSDYRYRCLPSARFEDGHMDEHPTTASFWQSMLKPYRGTILSWKFAKLAFDIDDMEDVVTVISNVGKKNNRSMKLHEHFFNICPSCKVVPVDKETINYEAPMQEVRKYIFKEMNYV